MGTGKSYWGARWAKQHQMHFFDLDTEIEKAENATIAQIFEQKGESFFREKEREILHHFAGKKNFILSTGGGTPCFFDNIQWMNQEGVTVFLETPVPVLLKRLAAEKDHRPLVRSLTDDQLEAFIRERLLQRSPFYSQAKMIVSTELVTDTTFDEIKRVYV